MMANKLGSNRIYFTTSISKINKEKLFVQFSSKEMRQWYMRKVELRRETAYGDKYQ